MGQEMSLEKITPETCFVPATHKGRGRRTAVSPGKTPMRYLNYGRITLVPADAPLSFANGDQETALICLQGSASIATEGQTFVLARYDALYVPRDSQIEVTPSREDGCDLAEVAASVSRRYPLKFVAHNEVRQNPKLHLIAGKAPAERDLNVLVG